MQLGNSGNTSKVVSLKKGQRVSLSKVDSNLKHILVGLGWDIQQFDGLADFDLDASVFLCTNDRCEPEDFIFYNNLKDRYGCCEHLGDNRTGAGEGDDEQIIVDLTKVPSHIDKIAVTVTIFNAEANRQNFGQVKNAFIRLVNSDTEEEVLRYELAEDFSVETAVVIAEIYRYNGDWKFNAIGSGFNGGLKAICANYGIDAE